MSGRKQRDAATTGRLGAARRFVVPRWRQNTPVAVILFASLMVLVSVACIPSAAGADVDMTGKIAPGPASKSGLSLPGLGAEPLVNSEHDGVYHCSDAYSTIANVAGGLAIGNCPQNEEFDVEDYGSGGESGYFYGGYFANVGACAWVKISEALKEKSGNLGHCSNGIGYEYGTFYSKINTESPPYDGFYVNNSVACEEYANVYPWGADTAAGPIRSVPAYTESHENAGYPALKWRYVTNNGKYVMVRDATVGGGEGNWVFVERSCLPTTLPSASEKLPPKPTVTTDGPSGVATTNATLHAEVNPNGLDTKYFFEYGTTESYGFYTTTEDAGAGTTTVPVSAAISGLAPYTTYYYRIVASSATGEVEGGPVSFKTQAVPPTVTTAAATGVQFRRATLNGKVNPNGAPTEYYYQYGLTTAYGLETGRGNAGSGSSPVTAPIVATGLTPNTGYEYRLCATNPGGTACGGNSSLSTAAPPVLSISKPSPAAMTLSWTASANAVNYSVVRNGVTVASTTSVTYVDAKLHAATFDKYEIVANDESESAGSSTVTRATTPLDTVAPDLTGEGRTDLAYFYPGGYIDSFLSKGNGTYGWDVEQVSPEFNTEQGLWLSGDVTGKGRSDLIYIVPGGYIDTFLSNGNGTYEEKQVQVSKEFNDAAGTWEVGDFTGDGKADLVYIYGNVIDTFLSNGNGTYEEKQEEVSSNFNSTAGTWEVGDFTDNGKTDLAYVVEKYIDTFLSNGNGTYEEKQQEVNSDFNSTAGQWEVGNFSGNGKEGLAYIVEKYIDTFLSNGNGTYEEKQEEVSSNFNSTAGPWLVGYFNGGAEAGLAYVYPGGYIDTFLSKGTGTYEEKQELIAEGFNSSTGQWRTGDFNDDGKTDLSYVYPGGYIDTFLSKGLGTYEWKVDSFEGFDDTHGIWL